MKRRLFCFLYCLCLSHYFLTAQEEAPLRNDIQTFSEQAGYLIAQDVKKDLNWLDLEYFIQGIKKYIAGDPSMKSLTDVDHFDRLMHLEYRLFEHQAETNLKQAEILLQQAGTRESAHVLENGKIIYEIIQSGNGTLPCSMNNSITMGYNLFDSMGAMLYSKEKVSCRLDDLLPAFSQAVVGMRQGEIRKIYIHPELAYGKLNFLHANSLFIAEVKLISME